MEPCKYEDDKCEYWYMGLCELDDRLNVCPHDPLYKQLQEFGGSKIMKEKFIAQSDDTDFEARVKELLLYRKIIKVEKVNDQDGILTLDNGTQLIVQGNVGCGGCGNGWYYLDELNGCDNAITNVECSNLNEAIYNIFIYAEDKRINCVQYSGDDNGYYGTGYYLYVKIPNSDGGNK